MDGSPQIARQTPRDCRLQFLNSFRKPLLFLVFCAIYLGQYDSVRSADRPSLFHRIGFRPNGKAQSTATAPPSKTEAKSSIETTSATAQSVVQQSQINLQRTNEPIGLHRFPQNTESATTSGTTVDEFALEFEEAITPIDLPTSLRLAGWSSPEVSLAQQRVLAVTARQQLAAAQALPNLNVGTNYDSHTGALQRASGLILKVERSALYLGAGANAVAAGTVNIPGLQYNLNVGETYFANLVSRQQTERFRAAAAATQNETLLQIAVAYCQLVQAQGTRAIAVKICDEAAEVARITASFADIGQGRSADAERAATELGRRNADIFSAEAAIAEASARLSQILNLETSIRLQSSENWLVPRPIVPDPIPLPELIAIALYRRPEVAERRAEVHSAMLELDNARLLLFSPQFIAGFSDGVFGGGSDVNAAQTGNPRFGNFGNRTDEDIVLYWSIRNLGLANRALIKTATARLAATNWEQTRKFNDIRAQVADAYARTQARAAQLDVRQRAVASSERGFREDLLRAKAGEGLPIEVLDSLRLLARSQQEYLETIASYNQAHYELYVAIGQPPADLLVHTDPTPIPPAPSAEQK